MSQVISGLWLDKDDADRRIDDANVEPYVKDATRALRHEGLAVVRSAHAVDTCRQVIEDYERYRKENLDYVLANLDTLGREKRLVNFHLWSDAAARIGTSAKVMQILDFVFGSTAAVYTSLTFKFGTQQPVHRDAPHFATWPANMFVGVWTALEPVDPSAGPLFYHPGAHRFAVDQSGFFDQAKQRIPNASPAEQAFLALDLYNGEIIRRSSAIAPSRSLELAAGDTVIWHPQLPHGGSAATNPMHTRWSIVFHCAPTNVQVHQHDRYFTHRGTEAPPARYGYRELHGRKVAVAGDVAYM